MPSIGLPSFYLSASTSSKALSLQKKDLPWRKDPATDKQLELLSRETGLPHDDLVSWASKGQRDGKIPAGVPPGTMRPVERRATTDMGTSATDEDRKDRRVSGKTSGALSAPQVKAGMTKGECMTEVTQIVASLSPPLVLLIVCFQDTDTNKNIYYVVLNLNALKCVRLI